MAFFSISHGFNQLFRLTFSVVQSNSTYNCTQTIGNHIVKLAICENIIQVFPLKDHTLKIVSISKTRYIKELPTLTVKQLNQGFRKYRLTLSSELINYTDIRAASLQDASRNPVHDVQQLLKQINARAQPSIQFDVPVLFSELIQLLNFLIPAEQIQVWEQIRSGEFGSSSKLLDIFLDASALAGNEGSAEVLIQAFQQQQISQLRANYLFGLLSFVKQPSVQAAQRLLQFVQQQGQQTSQLVQIPRGILFGITGFVNNLQTVQEKSYLQNPNVDQVVLQMSNLLVQGLEQFMNQISNQKQEHQALTVVFALRNLILVQNQHIAQQLMQILKKVKFTEHTQKVFVSIVQTLFNAGLNDQIRQYLLDELIKTTDSLCELQIETYKAVVLSGATTAQLQKIKQYTDQIASGQPQQLELVNYIRSHQANLRTTSDPNKQTVLPLDAPIFTSPLRKFAGISRNYLISYVNKSFVLGFTAEADIIYNHQQTNNFFPVPQTVQFNLTIPIGGSEFQLVEVRLHQYGIEPVISKHLAKIQQSGVKEPWRVAMKIVEYIIQHGANILAENPQICLLFQLSFNGKTVILIDEHDLIYGEVQSESFVQELIHKLQALIKLDRAFAFTPIDTVVQFPSVGLPVQVRINSSVVLGLRTELNFDVHDSSNYTVNFTVYPSAASQLDTAIEYYTSFEPKIIEYLQNFYSSPQLNLSATITNGSIVSFKFNLPEPQYTLSLWKCQVYVRDLDYLRVPWAQPKEILDIPEMSEFHGQDIHVCTQSTQNPLGIQLCFNFSKPSGNGIDVNAEVYVVKTDQSLQFYELYFESPYSFEELFAVRGRHSVRLQQQQQQEQDLEPISQIALFKFAFNTPGTQINRQIVFAIELLNSHTKEARLLIQTPWKRVEGEASYRFKPKEQVASMEINVNDKEFLQMKLTFETNPGQMYPTRLVASMNSLEASVNFTGYVFCSLGPVSSIHFNLNDVQTKPQLIKGEFTFNRNIFLIFGRIFAKYNGSSIIVSAKLTKWLFNFDFYTDYKLPSQQQRHLAKIFFDVQNLSHGNFLRFINNGLVKSSQYPQCQVNYDQKLFFDIIREYFEYNFWLRWAAHIDEQIRLNQQIKNIGLRGQSTIESRSMVVFRPLDIKFTKIFSVEL